MSSLRYDAIVLAGGRGARLGMPAKPQVVLHGRTLLSRVLEAVEDAAVRIVVGPDQEVPAGVLVLQEDPPYGGPVAALAAGLELVRSEFLVVLAADLPYLDAGVIQALLAGIGTADGAMAEDDDGRAQYLLGAWRSAALRDRLAELGSPDASMHRLLAGLSVHRLTPDRLPDRPAGQAPWTDLDTPADLLAAQRLLPSPPAAADGRGSSRTGP